LSSDRFHTYYEAAAKIRAELTHQLRSCLRSTSSDDNANNNDGDWDEEDKFDLLLVPTTAYPAPNLDADADPTEMFANDVMTVPISLAGLAAVSVPIQMGRGRHGLQLVAAPKGEEVLLRVASVLDDLS
jgi:aspartyl-tRNA(Asn)/glutamyl-tRNA(Gln) amidotransferase subunit A